MIQIERHGNREPYACIRCASDTARQHRVARGFPTYQVDQRRALALPRGRRSQFATPRNATVLRQFDTGYIELQSLDRLRSGADGEPNLNRSVASARGE